MHINDNIRQLYQKNKKLFALICRFNGNPASYTHPSHYQAPLPASILSGPQSQRKLSQWLSAQYDLENNFFTDFDIVHRRLALLDRFSMDKLIAYAGAAYYSENITQVIQKDVVLSLKKVIGEDAYLFAVKRAPFFLKTKPRLANIIANPANLDESVPEAGHKLIENCFANEPEALITRLKLHFPKDSTWDFTQPIEQGQQTQIWNFLHKILIKEISPSWAPCFT